MRIYVMMIVISSLSLFAKAQNDTAKANTTMNEATVYFGYGAELTHKAKVNVTTSKNLL